MLRGNFPNRRKQRQQEALARQASREKRSAADQLARLDQGNYVAQKERRRLLAQ